jgi:hypothetical protein
MSTDISATLCLLFVEKKRLVCYIALVVVDYLSDQIKNMVGVKRKRKYRTNKTSSPNTPRTPNRSSRIMTKNFEIFVTDFLTDPCGLPLELKDCVLIDGTTSMNDTSGLIKATK